MAEAGNNSNGRWWNNPLLIPAAAIAAIIGTSLATCSFFRVGPLEDDLRSCQLQLRLSQFQFQLQLMTIQQASQITAFEEQKETIDRLLEELSTARAEQPSNADQLFAIEVTLFTTDDDKDDQDVVTIEVWNGEQIVASQRAWAGVKLDNGETHSLTLAMPPKTKFTAGWQLKVRKSGTDGWIFHVAASGTFGDGQKVELLSKSDEKRFKDDPDSLATFPLRR